MKPVNILLSLTLLWLVVATNAVPAGGNRLSSRQEQQQTKESHPLSLPLRRYKGKRNHHIQRRQQPTTSASTVNDDNDTVRVTPGLYDMAMTEFAIPISIGSPAREFLLLFDTGSADTWVIGPSCTNTTTCAADNGKAHKPMIDTKADLSHTIVYDPKESTTYASTPYDFIINYAIGSSNGTYAVDRVAVDNAVLSEQMFAVVNDTEHFFTTQDPNSQYTIDGILGASYPWSTALQAYYNVTYLPIPFALYAAHLIPEPVFSVHMGQAFQQHNNTDTTTDDHDLWTGSVTFGAVNTSIVDPQAIRYTNISVWRQFATNDTGYMFWDGRANHITMESNNTTTSIVSWNVTHAPSFIIDTGSNYFSMPEQDVQELVINHLAPEARIREGQGGYFVNCNNTRLFDNNTTLSIHFYDSEDHTGATFPLTFPISDLVFQVDQEHCILAISPGKQYVVGNFILYRFLSIFDFGRHRVGFAPLQGSS